jgi:4-amino-4-deoxy-L-arabinose transferase-like glycosyltransferase
VGFFVASPSNVSTTGQQLKPANRLVDWQIAALLFVAASLVFVPFLGTTPMIDPTDSFFTESAREMLDLKSFACTFINYEPWLDKPALHFWFIILAFKLFGINEFAGRLPSALSGIFEVVATYCFSRHFLTRRQSLLSASILLSLPLFISVGRVSLTDEPLSLCLTVSLFSFAILIIKKRLKFLFVAYLALAVAVLIKGPFALVLVGLILAAHIGLTSLPGIDVRRIDFQRILGYAWKLHPIAGVLGILLLTSPYYIWAHNETHGAFTTAFFFRQNFGRMVGVVNHVRPFWWYLPISLGGFFPWSLLVAFWGPWILKIWKRKEILSDKRLQMLVFAACWLTVTFCFFSAIPTKLYTYIIPLSPAFALLLGCFIDSLIMARKTLPLYAVSLFFAAGLIAGPFIVSKIFDKTHQFLSLEIAVAAVLLASVGAAFYFIRGQKMSRGITVLCATLAIFCAVFVPLMFTLYYNVYQLPIDNLVAYALKRKANLAVVNYLVPSTMYHYKRKLPLIKDDTEMQSYGDETPGMQWILISDDVLSVLAWTNRSPRAVCYDGHWWLFAIGPNCKKEGTVPWVGLYTKDAAHKPVSYPKLADMPDAK